MSLFCANFVVAVAGGRCPPARCARAPLEYLRQEEAALWGAR